MKLMIVDDNANWREYIRNEFVDTFSDIFECEDGSQALTTYRLNKPEWVFMDIKMKKMDGLKAAKQILEYYPMAKIIVLTTYDSNLLRSEAKNAGVVEYLTKDELDKIYEIINNITNK